MALENPAPIIEDRATSRFPYGFPNVGNFPAVLLVFKCTRLCAALRGYCCARRWHAYPLPGGVFPTTTSLHWQRTGMSVSYLQLGDVYNLKVLMFSFYVNLAVPANVALSGRNLDMI